MNDSKNSMKQTRKIKSNKYRGGAKEKMKQRNGEKIVKKRKI